MLHDHLGCHYRNVNDGRTGMLVEWPKPGMYAIAYLDRADLLHEKVNQLTLESNWTNELGPSRKIRPEEAKLVATVADNALRAIMKQEPFLWHIVTLEGDVFDTEFHKQVKQFLEEKYDV